ncbi:hypothetical protein ARMGADRAFT_224985 [Armillaria gallica]|uniref:Uncharacterized protein n=1 Tax=Armillaria gallica TaxID=47427 RepID=A0A2H3ELJ4_ARMGA|nr:hypothetical protein ARMGADRAFT_224985 [Armillaria gallica]
MWPRMHVRKYENRHRKAYPWMRRIAQAQPSSTLHKRSLQTLTPSHCLWDGFSKASTIWETRDAHLKHLENHLTWLASVSTSGESRRCNWEPVHTDWHLSDWAFHFTVAHDINPNKAVIVDHCALCGEWVEDHKGDRSAWNAYCKTHYKTMFSPLKHRLQGHVSSRP